MATGVDPATPLAASPAPDWDAIDMQVVCPLCTYNLRGLIEPRCPECGYPFAWPDLLDPARRPHPYLFEHHPRRNAQSFLRTYFTALLPRRFWRSVQPIHTLRIRRLLIYWVLTAALLALSPVLITSIEYGRIVVELQRQAAHDRAYMLRNPNNSYTKYFVGRYGSIEKGIAMSYPLFPQRGWRWARERSRLTPGATHILLVALAWPWLTLTTLMIFRASMRRAMVRTGHVLRCAIYSCDWTLWLGVVAALAITEPLAERWVPIFYPVASMPMLAALLFGTYTNYRLGFAYSRYLKFDRPFLTVLAAQVVAFLFVTVAFVIAVGT
jgi:hypothetical protein